MEYIKVLHWDKFQHYKDRNPPWIKLYNSLLREHKYYCLQDASKLLLISLWLVASCNDNKIPYDLVWIKEESRLKFLPTEVHIDELISYGWIKRYKDDSIGLADYKQVARLEESREEESREEIEKNSCRKKRVRPTSEDKLIFEKARTLFPGTKVGFQPEFDNFRAKHKDWKEIIPLLIPAIEKQIIWHTNTKSYWQHFKTWINNFGWTKELEERNPDDDRNIREKLKFNSEIGGTINAE